MVGGIVGLLVGTFVGRAWAVGWLSHPLVLLPWQLDLYVVGLRIWVSTNLLGLLAGLAGLLLARVL